MARKKLDTLTEQMYYLLLALNKPGHGYAIMERVREMTDGRLQIGPGTLYTLLGRFESEWVIQLDHIEENRKVSSSSTTPSSRTCRDFFGRAWLGKCG